jgi:hypothetical protein
MVGLPQYRRDHARLGPQAHLSRLGAGLLIVGGAGAMHLLWGVAVDVPMLLVGAGGLVWALWARHESGLLAGIVLLAVALFALLDDHRVFTGVADALTLLALAAALVLARGWPVARSGAWPFVPAGALVLLAAFSVVRLAAAWLALPWAAVATLLVLLCGLGLLLWDARGGHVP